MRDRMMTFVIGFYVLSGSSFILSGLKVLEIGFLIIYLYVAQNFENLIQTS